MRKAGLALALTGALLFAGCGNGDDDAAETDNGIENGDDTSDDNGDNGDNDNADDPYDLDDDERELAEMSGAFPSAIECDEFAPAELPSGDDAGEGQPSEENEFALALDFGDDNDQVSVARGQQIVYEAETEEEWVDADNAFDSVDVDGTVRSIWPVGEGLHAPVQVRWVDDAGCPYVLTTAAGEMDEDGDFDGGHEPEDVVEYAERF